MIQLNINNLPTFGGCCTPAGDRPPDLLSSRSEQLRNVRPVAENLSYVFPAIRISL